MTLKNTSLWNSTLYFNFWIIILKYLLVPSVMEIHHDNHHTLLYFYIQSINILLWLWFLIPWLICEIPLDTNHLIHGLYQAACVRTKSCLPHRIQFLAWGQRYKIKDTQVIRDFSYREVPSQSEFCNTEFSVIVMFFLHKSKEDIGTSATWDSHSLYSSFMYLSREIQIGISGSSLTSGQIQVLQWVWHNTPAWNAGLC